MLKFNISRFMILQKANSVNSTRAISKKYVSFQDPAYMFQIDFPVLIKINNSYTFF